MDIKKSNQDGVITINQVSKELNTIQVNFEIPILFTNIDSGPRGLNNVAVNKITFGDSVLFPTSNATFHPFQNNLGTNSIVGDEIVSPIIFRDTENENSNLLILVINVDNVEKEILEFLKSQNSANIGFDCQFNFINSRKLQLEIDGEVLGGNQGKVLIKEIKRGDSALLTKTNLLLLIILIFGLSFWNYWINRDIYLQEEFLTQEKITAFIAVLGTFLGLSVSKIRGVFAVLSNITAFFKFPEIHLTLVQFDNFSSKIWFVIITLFSIVAAILLFIFHPLKVNEDFKYGIYDVDEKQYVNLEKFNRFYPITLKSHDKNNRFEIHLQELDSLRTKAVSIGELNPTNKTIEYYKFNIKYIKNNVYTSIENKTAEYYLKNPAIFKKNIPFAQIFAKQSHQRRIGDFYITYNLAENNREIQISDLRNITKDEIYSVINQFKKAEKIKEKDLDAVNRDRINLVKKLKSQFEKSFGENGLIKRDMILSLTEELIDETGKGENIVKKSIERYIILTALWQASEERLPNNSNQAFSSEDLVKICNSIKSTLKINVGWKRDRSIMAFVFEVQKQIGLSDKTAIDFMDKEILCNKRCNRAVNLFDFAVASSIASANELTVVQEYLREKLPDFVKDLINNYSYEAVFEYFKKYEESPDRQKDLIKNSNSLLKSIEDLFKKVT